MRVRIGFCWLGCLALAGACGGSSLGSGLDAQAEETGGTRSPIPASGAGGRAAAPEPPSAAGKAEPGPPSAIGGEPGVAVGGAPEVGGAPDRAGASATGGVPRGTAPMGGAAVGPPPLAGFGGLSPTAGGASATAGFAAFGGMFVSRSVPVPPPEPALLDECVYSVDCPADDSCNCQYECPNDTPFASCFEDTEREPDGTWTCKFSASGRAESYRVGGVDAAGACHIIADLAGGEPEYAGDERCVPERDQSSEDSCVESYSCVRPIVFGDGSMATLGVDRYIECSEQSQQCLVGDVAYHADDFAIADRCDALVPYLEEPPEPVFDAPPDCATTITEEVVGGCQTTTLCSWRAEVGASVSIERQEIVYAACESNGYGGSRCACARDDETLRFDTPWPTNDATACEVARGACEGGLEFTDEVECRQRYVSVDTVYCESMADCTRPASLAGADVVAIGTLQASCAHDGDAYACRCVNANQGRRIEVDAPSNFEGCVEAGEACRDALDLRYVGESGSISAPAQ